METGSDLYIFIATPARRMSVQLVMMEQTSSQSVRRVGYGKVVWRFVAQRRPVSEIKLSVRM